MEEWKEYKLGDFMEFNPKIQLKKNMVARKITMDQLIPHSRDIYSWTYEPYSGGAKFQNGDTIMARITPCLENGKHAFISLLEENEIAYGSTEYIVMRGRKDISSNLFVYYLSHFHPFKYAAIKSMVGSSGRQRAQVDVLENLSLFLPPHSEQIRIANLLSMFDDKIENNRRINENLEQQAQALFKSWFVDFEPFKDKPFVESELGMIPEGWKVCSLKDVCESITDGVHNSVSDDKNGSYYLLSCKNIKGGELSISKNDRRINEETFNRLRKRTRLNKGDILLSSVGTIGELLLLNENPINYEFQRSVAILKPNIEKLSSIFLYFSLKNQKNRIINAAHGAVQQCLFISDISKLLTIYPPCDEIVSFTSIISPLIKQISYNQIESRKLSKLRDTLLPKLMSGEIKV